MRNVFSFALAGALGLSAAVGATSFATIDFEEVSFPQVLTDLGFGFSFSNATVEPEAPELPSQNTVVRLRPATTFSPFDIPFEDLASPSAFDTAFTISSERSFGFDSALVDASDIGSGQVLAFATRNDGSFVGQALSGFNTGGFGLSSFSPSASAFGSGLTSLSFAATGAGSSVAFDDIVLCDPFCEVPGQFQPTATLIAEDDVPPPGLTAVPLPASALLLTASLGGLGLMRRRRRA